MKSDPVPSPDYIRFQEMYAELGTQSDRGCALILAANLDNRLSALLKAFCVDLGKEATKTVYEGNGFLASFSSKITLCYMLGLLSDNEYHDLGIIRKVRNFFAHEEHGWDFMRDEVRSRCGSLRLIQEMRDEWPQFDAEIDHPKAAFMVCAGSLSLSLLERAKAVGEDKRTVQKPHRIL